MLRPSSFAHPHSVRASRFQRLRPMASALVLATLAVLPAPQVLAQAFPTWQGTGTNWSTAANWDVTYAYGQLEWQGAGNATSFNDLSSPQSQWRFFFSGSQAYTLSGADVHFFDFGGTNGGIISHSSALQTINMNLSFRDSGARPMGIIVTNTSAGGLTFNGQIELTNGMTFLGIGSSNANTPITFNGSIVGNKGIIIGTNVFDVSSGFANGVVVFNGSNSYTGTTDIRRGTLVITNGNSLSTNNVLLGFAASAGNNVNTALRVNGTTTASNSFGIKSQDTNVVIEVTNGAAFTIAGNLFTDGGSSLSTKFGKAGAGTLILAGTASTYVGQVQIGDGTVVIGSSTSLGTNSSTATRAIDLGLNRADVNQTNNVSLLLSNNVTLSNSIYVSPNTISGTNYSRTLGVSGSGSATVNNQIFLDGNLTASVGSGNTLTISGNLTNTGGIIKTGAGTLILSAVNTNSGALDISNGVVLVSDSRAIAQNSTNNVVRSGGALELSNNIGMPVAGLVINGSGVGGTGGAIRSISGSNSINRNIALGSDARVGADSGAYLVISNFATNGAATINGTGFNLTVGGDGTTRISANAGLTTIGTGAGGSVTKVGAGTLILSGTNTYTGNTTVSSGVLQHFSGVANSILSSNVVVNGGQFRLVGGGSDNNITNTANLNITAGEFLQDEFRSQTLAQLNMSGGVLTRTDNGIYQFSGASTLTGGTINITGNTNSVVRFNNGLALGGASVVYSNASNAIANNVRIIGSVTYASTNTASAVFSNAAAGVGRLELGSATNLFDIADAAGVASEVNINWSVVGSGALRKTGTGTMTLAGTEANTYSGNTVVDGGTLVLNKTAGVNAVASGNVTVGSTATLLVSANNQVADTSAVTLSGGTIVRGSGVSETFGNLNLTADSFLDYGTGAIGTLTFGTYSPAFKLSVNNFLIGNVLRFTTDLSTDINNTSLFAFDSAFSYDWNTTTPGFFTITAVPEPSTVLAAIGLSGLMLWGPVRRRLQRSRK